MKRPRNRQAAKPAGDGAQAAAQDPRGPWAEKIGGLLRRGPKRTWWFALLLVTGTIVAYLPVWHAGLIWDDRSLVLDNSLIHRADGLYQFWFSTHPVDYYPMTSTILWVEWRLWGANPMGYHVINVLLHALSAVLLWRVLQELKLPGAWLAAAIFAVHPVNVESVAWIAERKNVLAMVFFLLSLLWYLRLDPAPVADGAAPQDLPAQRCWYWLSLAAFLLALLSKTVVAPMPLVLLGLIWWRQGRVQRRDVWRTLPFFAAAVGVGLISFWFQSHRAIGSDIVRTDSFWARLAGAGWAVCFYLYKAVLPVGLSTIYPRWQIDGGQWWSYVPGLLVVAVLVTCGCYRQSWGKGPFWGLGYFVVMLLPVLGFLDIGFMSMSLVADHWQYFAIIGPISLAAAAITTVCRTLRIRRLSLLLAMAAALLLVLGGLTWWQSALYADPGTFWRAALAANSHSWQVHNNLGSFLFEQGRVDEAMVHFKRAVEIEPGYARAQYNLAGVLNEKGQVDEAITHFQRALEIQPGYSMAHYQRGEILRQRGRLDEAIAHFRRAVEIRPDYAEAHNGLGVALLRKGQVDEAITHLQRALEIQPNRAEDHNNLAGVLWQRGRVQEAIMHYQRSLAIRPDYALAHHNLGKLLQQEGRVQEAVAHYQRALEIQPDFAAARGSLAWVFATSPQASLRDGGRAVELAQEAVRVSGDGNPMLMATLAAAYAEARRFPEAMETAKLALELAATQNRTGLANRVRAEIAAFRTGSPYRDTGRPEN
jgi:tetratricopeptide (TPR) repeat protein